MAKMSAINRDTFSHCKASNSIPYDLFVSERRPSMRLSFFDEFFNGSANWRLEQRSSSDTVIVNSWLSIILDFIQPGYIFLECVPRKLSTMSVKITNFVSCKGITAIFELLLHRCITRAMSSLSHFITISLDRIFGHYSKHIFQTHNYSL